MKINKQIVCLSAAMLMTVPAVTSIHSISIPQVVQAAKQKSTITVTKYTDLYNSKGTRLKTYKGKNFDGFAKATTFKYYGSPVKIKNQYYYYVGNGAYAKADYIYKINGKDALSLNHNAYVYTKSGKRTNQLLRKDLSYAFTGKYELNDHATNYFFYQKSHKYQLVTTKIKGSSYFKLAANQYIKIANISNIKSMPLIFSQSTAIVKKSKTPLMVVDPSGDLINSGKTLRKGQKLIVDATVVFSDGGNGWIYPYRIKGTNTYVMENAVSVRNSVDDLGNYSTLNTYLVRPPKDDLQFYNAQGENITPSGYFFQEHLLIGVDSKMYLWIPSENKSELVYHIVATKKSFYRETSPGHYEPKEFDLGDAFIKVSDTEIWEGKKKPQLMNTAQEAESDAKTQASANQLTNLRMLLNKAIAVKDTAAYKLSAQSTRQNYDATLKEDQTLLNSKRNLSLAEVKLASWILQTRMNNLYGKKIKVGNINKLTSLERNFLNSLLNTLYFKEDKANKTITKFTYDKVVNKVYLITTKTNSNKVVSQVEYPLSDFVTEK